jgi:hypothetical protein
LAARTQSSSGRPSLAVLFGIVAVLAIPVGIALAKYDAHVALLDAAWAIPVAALASVAALLEIRGTGGHVRYSIARVKRIRAGRVLAVLGVCMTLSAAIAVGFYELLLRLEG